MFALYFELNNALFINRPRHFAGAFCSSYHLLLLHTTHYRIIQSFRLDADATVSVDGNSVCQHSLIPLSFLQNTTN